MGLEVVVSVMIKHGGLRTDWVAELALTMRCWISILHPCLISLGETNWPGSSGLAVLKPIWWGHCLPIIQSRWDWQRNCYMNVWMVLIVIQISLKAFPADVEPITTQNTIVHRDFYSQHHFVQQSIWSIFEGSLSLTSQEEQGMGLFFSDRLRCSVCHGGVFFDEPSTAVVEISKDMATSIQVCTMLGVTAHIQIMHRAWLN